MNIPNDDQYLEANMEAQDQELERRRFMVEANLDIWTGDMVMYWIEDEKQRFEKSRGVGSEQDQTDAERRWWRVQDLLNRLFSGQVIDGEWAKAELVDCCLDTDWGDE